MFVMYAWYRGRRIRNRFVDFVNLSDYIPLIDELSHDEKVAYQQKQLSLIDRSEASILNKLEQYFKGFTDRVVHNVETNLPTKNVDKDDLFDEEFEQIFIAFA